LIRFFGPDQPILLCFKTHVFNLINLLTNLTSSRQHHLQYTYTKGTKARVFK